MNFDQKKQQILENCKTIAVVGLSDNAQKPSYRVAAYLQGAGYRIVPINPKLNEVLGEKAYPDLNSVPFPVDLVDVFRKQAEVNTIVAEALVINPQAIWLQLGLEYEGGTEQIEAQGPQLVQNCCIMVEHKRLMA